MLQRSDDSPAAPIATELELTLAQQGLWFLLQEGGADLRAAYNVVLAFRIDGALDVRALRDALQVVANRHEALRSRISARDGVGVQQVLPTSSVPVINLRETTGDVATVAHDESARPIDFAAPAQGWRTVLVRPSGHASSAGTDIVSGIVFVFSHALFDEGSASVFLRDLALAWSGGDGEPANLNSSTRAAPRNERTRLDSSSGREALQRVVERLEGMPGRVALPRSGPSPISEHACEIGSLETVLDQRDSAYIATAARQFRVSVAAFYLAAWQVLLWRYTGQKDFAIALPVSARVPLEVQDAIGYFVNLAVVRARLDRGLRVTDLLDTVTGDLLDLLDAAAVPHPAVVRRLRRSGQQLQGAFLQVGFGHVRRTEEFIAIGGASWQALDVLPRYGKNELKLDVCESPAGTRLLLLYDRHGFEPALMDQMASDLRRVLLAMAEQPHLLLKDLPLLDGSTRERLLSWGGVGHVGAVRSDAGDQDAAPWVHQLFEAQAARSPQALAVLAESGPLSYGTLNSRANRLARRLRERGVGPDVPVGICIDDGAALLIAVLAVLKAGGAYLPLDPDYPAERLHFMVHDAEVLLVLSCARLAAVLPSDVPAMLVTGAEDGDESVSSCNLDTPLRPDHLAYCIYTSGSTGQPKGAANTHRGFANLVRWYVAECLDGKDVRALLASSPSFDLTQKCLLGPLAAGATLVIPAGGPRDVRSVREALLRHSPNVICCAPSAFRAFVGDNPGSLRTAVLGGEAIGAALAAQLHARGLRLFNSYGPTECADVAVRYLVPQAETEVPLGRPLPQVRLYVLDPHGQPVPPGAIGELHLAGACVGRGYIGQPGLTAATFIPDPFGEPGARMYRTGDLVRFRHDGLLMFLGRLDNQVKVRGFRMELGEIEAALLRCPGVREAAVLAPADEDGQRRLEAYLSAADGMVLEPASVHQALARLLPAHMLPSIWHLLPSLPLNASGKVDRIALERLQQQPTQAHTSYDPPADSIETVLAALWADVLSVERIGRHDDFFALGGHSLSATQLLGRVNERLGIDAAVRHLFDAPTVAAFAAWIRASAGKQHGAQAALPPIVALPRRHTTEAG